MNPLFPLVRMKSFGLGIILILQVSAVSCSTSGPVRRTTYPQGSQTPSQTSTPVTSQPAAPAVSSPAAQPIAIKNADQAVKDAQAAYQAGRVEEARNLIIAIPEPGVSEPLKTEYWNLRGLIELAQRQPELAQGSFQKALNQNKTPEFRGYYQYNYASALYESNRSSDAYDVLVAIDQTALDESHRQKVVNLKQRIQGKIPPSPVASPLSTPSSDVSGGTPATELAVYHGPVKSYRVGLLVPLSGKYENFGKKAQKAVELAFMNYKFELIAVDSGDTPASHLEGLRKLVEEDQVIAIIGPLLSKNIEQVIERAAYYQIPLISLAQVQGAIQTTAGSTIVSCSISNRDQAKRIAEFAMKERGYSKFAILAPSNKPGEEMAQAFWDEVESREGTITAFELYSPESTDFREPVDKALGLHYLEPRNEEMKELAEKRKELNITKKTMKTVQYFNLKPIIDFDAVFIADDGKIAGQVIPTFTYRDAKGLPFLGMSSWNSQQFLQRTQDLNEGTLIPVALNTLKPPKTTKAFYDLFVSSQNSFPGEFDAIAYDAASIALKVMNRSPSSRSDFLERLERVSDVAGATGEISVEDRRCVRELAIYSVKKGKFEVLD